MQTVRKVEIKANVVWSFFQSPTSRRYVAVCEELNLCLEADTEEEMRSLIPEAMHLLMTDLLEDNEIDAYLREKGWQAHGLPTRVDGNIKFDVPFELIAGERPRIDSARRHH